MSDMPPFWNVPSGAGAFWDGGPSAREMFLWRNRLSPYDTPMLGPGSIGALGTGSGGGGLGGSWVPPSARTAGLPSPVVIAPGGTGNAAMGGGSSYMPPGAPLRGRSMGGAGAAGAAGGATGPFAMGPVAATGGGGGGAAIRNLVTAGGAGFLSNLGTRAAMGLSNIPGATGIGRVGSFLGRHPYFVASLGPTLDQLVTGWTGSDRWGNAAGMALTGGAAGAGIAGLPGALTLGGIGLGAGLFGVNPSDIPVVGSVWDFLGGGTQPSEAAGPSLTPEEMQGTFDRVLTGLGADQDYVNRAWAQYKLSLELNPDLDEAQQTQLGRQVLQSAMSQLGIEQERQFAESNIAAVQAWMEPMMRDYLDRSQWYADNYATMGASAAQDISNPGLRSALEAQAAAYSAQQSASNSLALQQMSFYPEAFLGEVADAYEAQLSALQAQIDAGVMNTGLMMAPMPQQVSGYGAMGGASAPILVPDGSGGVVGMNPPWTMPPGPPAPTVNGVDVPLTGTTTTTVPQMQTADMPPAPDFITRMGPVAAQTWLDRHGHTLSPDERRAAELWITSQMPTVTPEPANSPSTPPTGTLAQYNFLANAGG